MSKYLRLTMVLLLLSALPAAAGEIAPGLLAEMSDLAETDVLKVMVVMNDQYDVGSLDYELHQAKAGLDVRHRAVITGLQSTATRSQAALLSTLAQKDSGVIGMHGHWLVNAVSVTADVATIRKLALRSDVVLIEPNLVMKLIEPAETKVANKTELPTAAVARGVASIRAHEVWYSLGIDGSGVLIGSLDTGVDATHIALSSKWRGNTVPAAQAWHTSANFGDPDFPSDEHGHGTHTMGTILGSTATDTVGVAPGAEWIASNTVFNYVSDFNNGIISALEFFADPDGDPGTTDDIPAVVNNSWGVETPDPESGYVDCESIFWAAIDNCEAAGVVLIFAAGNEGPDGSSLRSPADRATSATNSFSVGSVSSTPPFLVSFFSSRGPSVCGGPYAMKPEVTAPGSNIYSTWPGDNYGYLSGTSMAAPHVTGVVALMRQANPNVDVTTIKETLMATARDIGTTGEDNDTGWGVIDAYAAVMAVMEHTGTVSGVITDLDTGLPVAGALVARVGGLETFNTGEDGRFSFFLPSGPCELTVKKFGYDNGIISVTVLDDLVVDADYSLPALPIATVSGTITDPDGMIVIGGQVSAAGTPLASVTSDAIGFYSLAVPAHPTQPYTILATAPGLGFATSSVLVTSDISLDFQLPPNTTEDFESNHLFNYPWYDAGDSLPGLAWHTVPGAWEGDYCVRSGITPNNFASAMALDYDAAVSGTISFWYKLNSEENFDYFNFYVDEVLVGNWSGTLDWTRFEHTIDAGPHTFKWEYIKDASGAPADDGVRVDFITFPLPTIPPAPVVAVNTNNVALTLAPNTTGIVPVNIFNSGATDLTFKARLQSVSMDKNSGLDAFGYTWQDSDEAGGPIYDWLDIASNGIDAGVADDALLGPFALGFSLPFYQAFYDSVWIGTNGFLSFTGDSHDYRNVLIPDADEPNGMLAFFWDDMRSNQGGTIYYRSDPDSGRFIMQYENVIRYQTGTPHTMQVILYENGDIVYQYADVTETQSTTIGLENTVGTVGLNVSYNDPTYPHNNLAIRFDYPGIVDWVTAVPDTGVVTPGENLPISIVFNSAELPDGIFNAELVIQSNDPVTPIYRVPVTFTVSAASGTEDAGIPHQLVFTGAVPNPFNPSTDLCFSLPREAKVSLRIYDIAGRQVCNLVNDQLPAGAHAITWLGRDDRGASVASGIFFARLVVGDQVKVRRMTLVR